MNLQASPKPTPAPTISGLSKKLAGQVIFISERELDTEAAYQKIGAELLTKLFQTEKVQYFQSVLQSLLSSEQEEKYAAHALLSLFWQAPSKTEFKDFWVQVVNQFIQGHQVGDMPSYRHPDSNKVFSAYAYTLGETFIQMMKLGSEHYDSITQLFTYCIRQENNLEKRRRLAQAAPRSKDAKKFTAPANPKKLYDDIADFISERAVHRAQTLNPDNPNEFIQILSDRLSSTRRYVIQELINQDSIEKKRSLEKAFKAKQASAEELVYASKPFQAGLRLFKDAKLYNNRYVEAEKRRVTLQLVPMIIGVSSIGLALMDIIPLTIEEIGLILVLVVAGKFLLRPKFFQRFYPKDVTTPLEEEVSLVAAVFQKCSQDQLTAFLRKQLKEVRDPHQISLMMDFVTYVYSLIPKQRELLMNRKEFKEAIDSMSWHIAKARRGLAL